MPGLKLIVGPAAASLPRPPEPVPLAPEVKRRRIPVYSSGRVDVSFDVPEDYPSLSHADADHFLLIEGLVYDRTDDELVAFAAHLARRALAGQPVADMIREFQLTTDGDYGVLLVLQGGTRVIAFNDVWGRLPLYAARTASAFVLSREPQEILPYLPDIRFDPPVLAEWMALEFTLSDRWFVAGVDRVRPAELFDVTAAGRELEVKRVALVVRNLAATAPAADRETAARAYVERFLPAYSLRIDRLARLGYRLTADLSGGYDTRILFAGARRLGAPVDFYTEELVTGDESEVAIRLAQAGNWPVTRVPRGEFVRDAAEWRRLTALTGGRVNCSVMAASLHLTRMRRQMIPGRAARFMGFAGELMRHPPVPAGGYGGFVDALADDVYLRYISFRDACRFLGLDWAGYRRHLADTVAGWPEQDDASRCRRLYLFAYLGIGNAGEDRHRWHFWTVPPMWANPTMDFVYRSLGPDLTSWAFFVELLRQIYPAVLEAPIYGSSLNLASPRDVEAFDRKSAFIVRLRQHRLVRRARRLLRYPEKWATLVNDQDLAWIRDQMQAVFRESAAVRSTFDEAAVMSWLATQRAEHRLYQLLTSLWFVADAAGDRPGHQVEG